MVGPALSSPLRFLVGRLARVLAGEEVLAGEFWQGRRLDEVGGPKAWREKGRVGARRLHRPTPYAGPPPSAQSSFLSCRELSEREGGARHWRHLLSRALRGRAVP